MMAKQGAQEKKNLGGGRERGHLFRTLNEKRRGEGVFGGTDPYSLQWGPSAQAHKQEGPHWPERCVGNKHQKKSRSGRWKREKAGESVSERTIENCCPREMSKG